MKKLIPFIFLAASILSLNACKKSSEAFKTASIDDYNPLVVGKYITYNLDSLVYVNFGSGTTEIHSYQVKYEVDAQITDILGRPAYRIIRYKRNTATDPWAPDNTFMAVNTTNSLEFTENNQRFIKLTLPIANNHSWKGNSYIQSTPGNSDVDYLDDWDYIYDSVAVQNQVGSFTLDNCLVVNQRDEISGDPSDHSFYSQINYSQEKYAAGIGMIYRKFFHNVWQPAGYFETGSYGITLTMIDHN